MITDPFLFRKESGLGDYRVVFSTYLAWLNTCVHRARENDSQMEIGFEKSIPHFSQTSNAKLSCKANFPKGSLLPCLCIQTDATLPETIVLKPFSRRTRIALWPTTIVPKALVEDAKTASQRPKAQGRSYFNETSSLADLIQTWDPLSRSQIYWGFWPFSSSGGNTNAHKPELNWHTRVHLEQTKAVYLNLEDEGEKSRKKGCFIGLIGSFKCKFWITQG